MELSQKVLLSTFKRNKIAYLKSENKLIIKMGLFGKYMIGTYLLVLLLSVFVCYTLLKFSLILFAVSCLILITQLFFLKVMSNKIKPKEIKLGKRELILSRGKERFCFKHQNIVEFETSYREMELSNIKFDTGTLSIILKNGNSHKLLSIDGFNKRYLHDDLKKITSFIKNAIIKPQIIEA